MENETNIEVENVLSREKDKRKTWSGHCEYILSLFGYLSGAGDFWRFPYLFWKNGGGTFIIVYLVATLVCSVPLYYLEITISQYSGKGMFDVWCICPLFNGVCITMFIINVVLLLVLPTLRVWIMSYIRHSFRSVLPWTTCRNSWNTDACVDGNLDIIGFSNDSTPLNFSTKNFQEFKLNNTLTNDSTSTTMSAEEEFWRYELLNESSGIEDFGNLNWELVLYNFILRGLVVLCVIKGVKSIGKVMYVTTFIPIILLVTVWIRALTLPGSSEGLYHFLKPDFKKFADKQMWMEAIFAALNTVAIGMGGTLVIGSRGKFHSGIFRSTICACSLDIFGSIFTSVVLFSVLGVMAAEQNKDIASVVSAGTSVGFVGFTKAFSYLPGSQVWTIIFFIASFIALLDVIVMIKEVVVYFIMQWIPFCRRRHKLVIIGVFISSFILSLPYVTQAGPYIFQISEWYSVSWCTLITSLCEAIICMWIFGGDKIDDVIRTMIGKPMPAYLRVFAAFICPIVFTVFVVFSIVLFRPPTYGSYHYPLGAEVFGYCLGVLPIIPIPVVMVIKIYNLDGPLLKRFKTSLKPTDAWRPVVDNEESKRPPRKHEKRPLADLVFYNVTGRYYDRKYTDKQNGEEMTPVSL